MEKVKLIINGERFIKTDNPFGETSVDYLSINTYEFEQGNIYGVICEHGGGGEAISLLLSGEVDKKNEKIFLDNREIDSIQEYGWYMGKKIYSNGIIKKECSKKKLLQRAVIQYHQFENVSEIVNLFHLDSNKLDYCLSNNCEWEMWRCSLALGYATKKKIFCFPWMNSLFFFDCMYNSSVFRFFNMLKNEGSIIILPTSKEKNVEGLADRIIKIYNPRFEHIISESEYFKEFFN